LPELAVPGLPEFPVPVLPSQTSPKLPQAPLGLFSFEETPPEFPVPEFSVPEFPVPAHGGRPLKGPPPQVTPSPVFPVFPEFWAAALPTKASTMNAPTLTPTSRAATTPFAHATHPPEAEAVSALSGTGEM
jgi:hypothetical protein